MNKPSIEQICAACDFCGQVKTLVGFFAASQRSFCRDCAPPDFMTDHASPETDALRPSDPPDEWQRMQANRCERLCRFNCDAESSCSCFAHAMYRDLIEWDNEKTKLTQQLDTLKAELQLGHARIDECATQDAKGQPIRERISAVIHRLAYESGEQRNLFQASEADKTALRAQAVAAEARERAADYRAEALKARAEAAEAALSEASAALDEVVAEDPEKPLAQRIRDEFHDFKMLLDHCTEVYFHFTNGMISKPNTLPSEVIAVAQDIQNRDIEDAVKEATEELQVELAALRHDHAQVKAERDEALTRNAEHRMAYVLNAEKLQAALDALTLADSLRQQLITEWREKSKRPIDSVWKTGWTAALSARAEQLAALRGEIP